MRARLIESHEIAPNTRHFEFESEEWEAAFVPGQFVSLTANDITRAYSIVSAPGGHKFALCANLVQGGHLSPFLFSFGPGDEIDFKGPYGAFILRRPVSDSIFVATGTGIAPFRSMLSRLQDHPDSRFTLIFGVRHESGLLYHDELTATAKAAPNFDYRPTLTRPPDHWSGRSGRVQQHVMEALGDRRDMDVYICGLREMVDDMRSKLKEAGVDRKRIIYEKYD
jgi:CDP-4-dehydro-6-deoxyglucose reductase